MDISLKEIISALALIFAYWKYIDIRKRELRWKRTEFLFKQAELLDHDKDINLATAVLDGCDPNIELEQLFDTDGNINLEVDKKYRVGFEKMCNFLDRLAYAHLTNKTIDKADIANFGWYIESIVNHTRVIKYCENNGFEDIIKLSESY
ncbi:MAG: hypothetical protein R3182_09850 [Draconibacterium sp.]|nr:hypothetical protein [Draconibacterium sp.]